MPAGTDDKVLKVRNINELPFRPSEDPQDPPQTGVAVLAFQNGTQVKVTRYAGTDDKARTQYIAVASYDHPQWGLDSLPALGEAGDYNHSSMNVTDAPKLGLRESTSLLGAMRHVANLSYEEIDAIQGRDPLEASFSLQKK